MNFISEHVVIASSLLLYLIAVVAIVAIVRHVRKTQERIRIMRLDASAFHELAVLKRNAALRRDLTNAFAAIKTVVFRNSGEFRFGMKFSLHKWRKKYPDANAEQFETLFVKPLTARLEKDGFTVEYLPAGAIDMKKYPGSPAIELKWAVIKAPEEETAPEEKPEAHWN